MIKRLNSKLLKNKKVVVPTMLTLGVIMVGLLSVTVASAQESHNYPPIVQKLAQKFNLNEKDVQAVFDEERDHHFADVQARWSERLDDLVNEGKITKEQKEKITKKHEEIHNKIQELRDLPPQERRSVMLNVHDDLKSWAKTEGIDLSFIGPMKFRHKDSGLKGDRMIFFKNKID